MAGLFDKIKSWISTSKLNDEIRQAESEAHESQRQKDVLAITEALKSGDTAANNEYYGKKNETYKNEDGPSNNIGMSYTDTPTINQKDLDSILIEPEMPDVNNYDDDIFTALSKNKVKTEEEEELGDFFESTNDDELSEDYGDDLL